MENQRNTGILVMVISIVVAIVTYLTSDNDCPPFQVENLNSIPFGFIRYCLHFRLLSNENFGELLGYYDRLYIIDIQYLYILVICIISFFCGFLIKQNVIKIPVKSK